MAPLLPALSFCVIEGTALFLDLAGDRYFCLPEPANADFVASLVNGVAFASAFIAAGLEQFSTQAPLCAQAGHGSPRQPADLSACHLSLTMIARALWEQSVAERRLRKCGLHTVLSELQAVLCHSTAAAGPFDRECAAAVKAFEHAALLRSAVDRCLPRSIALARLLARYDCRSEVVLGVKLRPFAAHCWVQSGQLILNESVEEAARYRPILIL